jgi:hypothetical protein
MLCGCTPFQADTDEATRQRILSGAVTFPDHLSSPARALISGMLQVLSSSADESFKNKNGHQPVVSCGRAILFWLGTR